MSSYTTGQLKLAEKYMFYVLGNSISSYRSVPDSKVPEAQQYLTKAYAVRLTTIEDLDAIHGWPNYDESIDASVANYYKRPEKDDISRVAVERAVRIARNYTPYNNIKGSWTEDKLAAIPYVSVAPNVKYGQPPPVVVATAPAPTPENVTPKTGTDAPAGGTATPTPATQVPAQAPVTQQPTPDNPVESTKNNATGAGTASPVAKEPWYKKYWYIPVGGVALVGIGIYMTRRK